jgi:multiple sugar transport system permease protein
MRRPIASLLLHVGLIVGAIVTVTPLAWMASASFMPAGEANQTPPPLLPSAPTLTQYVEIFTHLNFARAFFNSVFVAVAATLLSLLINGMAGYAFAKLRFAGRERLFRLMIVGLVVPSQVAMLPLFLMLKSMGLVNTYMAAILPTMSGIFGIFMIRQYALGIPDDLLDAARLDGAGEWRIFAEIAVPVLQPILGTLALFTFMSTWNDFMWPLIVLSDDRLYTLPVALASLVGEHVQDTELMMAGSVITVTPVLLLYLILQRVYIRGLMLGSVKG